MQDSAARGPLRRPEVLRTVLGRDPDGGALTEADLARIRYFQAAMPWRDDLPLAEMLATAGDVMALFGQKPPEAVRARLAMMQVRGAARVRAGQTAPATVRSPRGAADVKVAASREPYARFFAVEEYDLELLPVSWTAG